MRELNQLEATNFNLMKTSNSGNINLNLKENVSNVKSISLDLDGLEKLETMMEISDDDEYQFLGSVKELLDLINKKGF